MQVPLELRNEVITLKTAPVKPRRMTITGFEVTNSYQQLGIVLGFDEEGSCLKLNRTSLRNIIGAWGTNMEDWQGGTVEVVLGRAIFDNRPIDAVIVTPVDDGVATLPEPASAPARGRGRPQGVNVGRK